MDRFKKDFARDLVFSNLPNARFLVDLKMANVDCIKKDSEFSQSLRKKGNEMYYKRNCDKEYEEIHEFYSKSIAYAPMDSDDLVLAYGNRSALLHRIGKHEESILDIDRALEVNKSDIKFRVKLLCRKVECLVALGSAESHKVYDQAKQMLSKIVDVNKNENSIPEYMKKAETALRNLSQVSKLGDKTVPDHMLILQKKELQNPFDSVAVKCDEKFGRHLVATKDIDPGEIIFVENSHVKCINSNKGHIYCGYCHTKTWASIPCNFCNWCMFCSKTCKDSAWASYHDIECAVISYLMAIDHNIEYPYQLSLRSLIMGVKEYGSINKFILYAQSIDLCLDDDRKKSPHMKPGFRCTYSLVDKVADKVFRKYIRDVFIILDILCKYTKFFGQNINITEEIKDIQMQHDITNIGTIFLKLWSRIDSNFNTVHDANSTCKRSHGSINCNNRHCSKGACIPSLSFFMNHSCYPNVKKCVTEDYKIIIFSLLPIKKDSQLFMSYQQPFFEAEKSLRQKQLSRNLDFVCNCVACTLDWPTIKELWRMPKDNPKLYIKNYSKLESDLYDRYDSLVRPIMINCQKAQYNQAKLRKISNAIEKVSSCLQQPSVVLCELMISLCLTFKKLYCSES